MRSPVELRREGFRALCDRLGIAGAMRFLAQYETGSGDYTAERRRIVGKRSVRDIVRAMRGKRRAR